MSASASAVSGVCDAGFTTAVLPHASAGAIFQLAITAGKFHGVISAHTPTGSRRVTSRPGGTIGIVSPVILFAAPPQYSKTLATMSISAAGRPRSASRRCAPPASRAAPVARGSVNEAFVSTRPRSRARHAEARRPRRTLERAMSTARRRVLGAGLRDLGHRGRGRRLDHLRRSRRRRPRPARRPAPAARSWSAPPRHRHGAHRRPDGVPFGRSATGQEATMRLDGKVALITGGGSGMGKVASELFASEGASVVLTDVNDEAGEATAAAIGDRSPLRARRRLDARPTREAMVARRGRALRPARRALQQRRRDAARRRVACTRPTESIWDTTLAINVKGVAFGCKYGIPAMLESGGGSIINVASFVAWMGAATSQTAYTASKGAVLAMTREIAVEYARQGHPVQRALPRSDRDAAAARAALRRGEEAAAVRPHPDGPARPGRGAREGRAVPRERRLELHDRLEPDRRRRHHRRLRDAGGLSRGASGAEDAAQRAVDRAVPRVGVVVRLAGRRVGLVHVGAEPHERLDRVRVTRRARPRRPPRGSRRRWPSSRPTRAPGRAVPSRRP